MEKYAIEDVGGGVGRVRERHNQKVRGGDRSTNENGIGVSDVTRYFKYSEWAKFLNDT